MARHHRLVHTAARLVWRLTKPRTIGVRAILLNPDGELALVRHTYTDQWYLPGGGVKKGESTRAALLRELVEEVAVEDAVIERILGVYHSVRESKDDHIVIFVARIGRSEALRGVDTMEIEQAGWFAPDALPPSTSPATKRRVAEYRAGITGAGDW